MTTEQDKARAVPVIQADRDAAAALATVEEMHGGGFVQHIIDGLEDDLNVVQAFARHRLAYANMERGEGVPWHSDLGGLIEAQGVLRDAMRRLEDLKRQNAHIPGNPYDMAISTLQPALAQVHCLINPRPSSAAPDMQPAGSGAMQHVAYFDEGEFHWMSGIKPRDCELYTRWPEVSTSAPKAPKVREAAPIDMLLFCPKCGIQHIDEPDERTPDWSNPPHRSHLCHGCGCIWRPADVPTNGVVRIATQGNADTWGESNSAALATPAPAFVEPAEDALRERTAIRDYLFACADEANRQRLKFMSAGNKLTARDCGSESKAYANAAGMIEREDHASYRAALQATGGA